MHRERRVSNKAIVLRMLIDKKQQWLGPASSLGTYLNNPCSSSSEM